MDVLRSLRKKKAKTQKDVAAFLGVDRTTYVKYEVGEHQPDRNTLIKLSDYFGVSIEYLIDDKVLPNDEAGEELNEICGKRLKSCRELANESLEFIGELVGVHKSTVLRWEQGKTKKMSIGALDVLARHFDVDIVWLSGESSFKTEYGYKVIKGRISCVKQELIEGIKSICSSRLTCP